MPHIILGQQEVYPATPNVWSFKQVNDIVNGINLRLSNMVGGFPFEFNGTTWKDSERLYLCGEYSDGTPRHQFIQEQLMGSASGYAAKRFVKSKFRKEVREDFPTFRLQWMLFCVWQKCKANHDFQRLLLSIPDDVTLVENTTTDKWESAEIWGCKNHELHDLRTKLKETLISQHQELKKKELEHPHHHGPCQTDCEEHFGLRFIMLRMMNIGGASAIIIDLPSEIDLSRRLTSPGD